MKMKRVLISTLGESPPVVTEALDILGREGKKIDHVILLTTKDSDTQESADLLERILYTHYQITSQRETIQAYNDIDSQEALLEFMIKACGILRDNRMRGNEVFVSIAGGRKTMSALMTLAVQIYGAKELFHIYIDNEELEKKSKITRLRHLSESEQNEILHPDMNEVKVVKMPFIGLFPWITDIMKTLRGEAVGKREIRELLISNKLLEEDGRPTRLGELFLKILDYVESRPSPCKTEPKIKLTEHQFKKQREEFAYKLLKKFSYICEIRDTRWREGKPRVKTEPPNKLRIYFKHRKGFNLGFAIKTTAISSGQLQVAEKEVREFLESV